MALTSSLVVGVKAPLECWPIAVDRVRYVGEPVAIVVASDRYRAEDAVDLIEMRYRPLPAVVDPVAAATAELAAFASGDQQQRRRRAHVSLRRPGARFRGSRASRPRRRPLPAQLLHADRNVRHRRRIRCR